MNQPQSLSEHRAKRAGKTRMPDPFPLCDVERLLTLARKDRRTVEECQYACEVVRGWAQTNGRLRTDWVLVVINAMRMGWGLKGYKAWWKRQAETKRMPAEYPGRPTNRENVEAVLRELRERGRS